MSKGKPLSFDRNEALRKALDLFWEKGYAKTGMTELLAHMGIQRQSFYNTFGNKEEVFIEALRLYGRTIMGKVIAILEQDRHPLENIKEIFNAWSNISGGKEGCGCLIGNTMTEFGNSKDAVGELLQELVHDYYDAFLQAFTRAEKNGYLSATKNPKVLATSFVAMMYGTTLLIKVGFGEEIVNDILAVAEELLSD